MAKSKVPNLVKIVATTNEEQAGDICKIAEDNGFKYYRGSEEDVLDRFYQAANENDLDVVIRVTSDCPLFDSTILDKALELFLKEKVDYLSNTLFPTFPRRYGRRGF